MGEQRMWSLEEFPGIGKATPEIVRGWSKSVCSLRWGSAKDFAGLDLRDPHPYYLNCPVGTGVLLENGQVLTCAHPFSPPLPIPFPRQGRLKRRAKFRTLSQAMRCHFAAKGTGVRDVTSLRARHVSYWGSQIDAAFVSLAPRGGDAKAAAKGIPGRPMASCASRRPASTDRIVMLHHPGGGPLQVSAGTVRATERDQFSHDAPTAGGSSGAPVFLEDGTLIGLHRGIDPGRRDATGVATPLMTIREFTGDDLDPSVRSVRKLEPGDHELDAVRERRRTRRSVLPRPPGRFQEVDDGTFEVGSRSGLPATGVCWIPSNGSSHALHEAWALKNPGFAYAGTMDGSQMNHLIFERLENWWLANDPEAPEPAWDSTSRANFKTWAQNRLGGTVQFVFHDLTYDPAE